MPPALSLNLAWSIMTWHSRHCERLEMEILFQVSCKKMETSLTKILAVRLLTLLQPYLMGPWNPIQA